MLSKAFFLLIVKTSIFFFFLQNFQDTVFLRVINSLPNNKFLDWSKLKAFADNRINVLTYKQKFFLEWSENTA